MHTTSTDLATISQEIWTAVLGIELRPAMQAQTHAEQVRVVTGTVQVTGEWSGAAAVQVSEELGCRLAATMFTIAMDEVTEDEVHGAVGELANVTGGNVRPTLEGACQLSLPVVTSGRDFRLAVPGSGIEERVAFDADGELVVVTLFERGSA